MQTEINLIKNADSKSACLGWGLRFCFPNSLLGGGCSWSLVYSLSNKGLWFSNSVAFCSSLSCMFHAAGLYCTPCSPWGCPAVQLLTPQHAESRTPPKYPHKQRVSTLCLCSHYAGPPAWVPLPPKGIAWVLLNSENSSQCDILSEQVYYGSIAYNSKGLKTLAM